MTPKEKAALLVLKYMSKVVSMNLAKECAIIAVDELIYDTQDVIDYHRYWEEVKQEIEKL